MKNKSRTNNIKKQDFSLDKSKSENFKRLSLSSKVHTASNLYLANSTTDKANKSLNKKSNQQVKSADTNTITNVGRSKKNNVSKNQKKNNHVKRILFKISIFLIAILVIIFSQFSKIKKFVDNIDNEQQFPVTLTVNKDVTKQDTNKLIQDCKAKLAKYDESFIYQKNILNQKTEEKGLSTFGIATPENVQLDDLAKSIEEYNVKFDTKIHMVLFDLNTYSGFAYNADAFCPLASAIKLPYIASLIDGNPGVFKKEKTKIENCLVWSDNQSYFSLYKKYGIKYLQSWCDQVGITDNLCDIEFPEHATARDMSLLWLKAYYFLNTCEYSDQLINMLKRTEKSLFQDILSDRYSIYSKPGWWDGPNDSMDGVHYDGIKADCGIINAGDNPYILVFYTENYPESDTLKTVINNIDKAHDSMFVKDIVCNNQYELDTANEKYFPENNNNQDDDSNSK